MFDRSASNLVATAELLLDLLEDYPARRGLVAEIKEHEHEGDRATQEIVRLLHKTFVTPFDREDIYNLATALDDVCDYVDEAADELNLYGVDEVPPETVEQARVIVSATGKLAEVIAGLEGLSKSGLGQIAEVHSLEDEGDRIVRGALARLFSGGLDPLAVIRSKAVLEHLEAATDSCQKVAHVLESVYLKNR
jgi:predicted phosphate transport protein (TIGR00153 family)